MKYTRVYADPDGMSHFEDMDIEFTEVDFAPLASFAFPVGLPPGIPVCVLPGSLRLVRGLAPGST
jgi:hypothetical protein